MNGKLSRHGALSGTPAAVALFVAALAVLVLPGAVEAEAPADRSAVAVYSGGVDFLPNVEYSRAVLTVSGNGRSFTRQFYPDDRLSIGMFDPEGQPLADGVYKWRLELRPTGDTAWELRVAASRAKNGGEAADAWEPLSGSFAIRNGSIADPDLIEPQAVPMRFPAGLAPTSGLQVARPTPVDDDAAVGSEIGVEEAIHSGDGDGEPAAFAAGPQIPFQSSSPRSDATALSLGRSLETNEQPAQSTGAAPARRSTSADGANGRPRSDEAQ